MNINDAYDERLITHEEKDKQLEPVFNSISLQEKLLHVESAELNLSRAHSLYDHTERSVRMKKKMKHPRDFASLNKIILSLDKDPLSNNSRLLQDLKKSADSRNELSIWRSNKAVMNDLLKQKQQVS